MPAAVFRSGFSAAPQKQQSCRFYLRRKFFSSPLSQLPPRQVALLPPVGRSFRRSSSLFISRAQSASFLRPAVQAQKRSRFSFPARFERQQPGRRAFALSSGKPATLPLLSARRWHVLRAFCFALGRAAFRARIFCFSFARFQPSNQPPPRARPVNCLVFVFDRRPSKPYFSLSPSSLYQGPAFSASLTARSPSGQLEQPSTSRFSFSRNKSRPSSGAAQSIARSLRQPGH